MEPYNIISFNERVYGYKCSDPGRHSGEYVKLDEVRKLVSALEEKINKLESERLFGPFKDRVDCVDENGKSSPEGGPAAWLHE